MMLQRHVAGHGSVVAVDRIDVLAGDDDDDDVTEACCWPWQCRCCGLY